MAAIELPPHLRKLLLMLSERNPFWKEILPGEANQTTIAQFTGISTASPWSWQKNTKVRSQTISKILKKVTANVEASALSQEDKDAALAKINQFQVVYKDDNRRPLEAGAVFGMNGADCRKILDEIIYKKRPLLPTAYYSENDAKSHFESYEGAYQVLIKMTERWIICAMHVRDVVSIAGGSFIRCKLNFPAEGKLYKRGHSVYDGVLVVRESNLFWMFEARDGQSEINDHSYFITRTREIVCPVVGKDGEQVFSQAGTYLTSSQAAGHPIISDHIILQHLKLDDYEARENYMHGRNGHKPIGFIDDVEECQSIDAMWQRLAAL